MKLCEMIDVLNLIITGIPSILKGVLIHLYRASSFKPYYNWNTFNTVGTYKLSDITTEKVLNLIITGIPSILVQSHLLLQYSSVLNLIITGIPSILTLLA